MLFGVSVNNILIGAIVHRCVTEQSAITRILSARLMTGLGVLSYSLYLWQQVFLNRHSTWAVCGFPQNVALAFAAAAASYLLVERPLNNLRGRFQRRTSH
jgi:peptidoglycan/LPS O-acetylase OafA/YrhL